MPKGRPMLTAYRCLRPVKVVFFCLSLTAVTQCCSHAAAIHNLQRAAAQYTAVRTLYSRHDGIVTVCRLIIISFDVCGETLCTVASGVDAVVTVEMSVGERVGDCIVVGGAID